MPRFVQPVSVVPTNYVPTASPKPAAGFDVSSAYRVAAWAGVGAGAYHGYKRNNSVGWAIGWALLGGVFPIITIPLSLAQGFGKSKK